MPLDPGALKAALAPLFNPQTMPTGPIPSVVQAWTTAYIKYASAATAGGTVPTTSLQPQSTPGPDFYTALDAGLRLLWMPVPWAGTPGTGVTLLVPPLLPLILPTTAVILQSDDPQVAISLIAAALHTYTLSITVTLTPPSGTPAVVPLL